MVATVYAGVSRNEGTRPENRAMVYALSHWKFTVDEFQRMGEAGIFCEDDRVELLDGELYEMSPRSDRHIGTVNRCNFLFGQRLGERAIVSVQNPIRLSDASEPQPDIALLRPRADCYRSGKAAPEDVLLLVEVSDSSLSYDRELQLPRYAASGSAEVWIVNLVDERIEVYREPAGGVYRSIRIYTRGDRLAPAAFPDLAPRAADILC
jgi:Uma2 family endonuclease